MKTIFSLKINKKIAIRDTRYATCLRRGFACLTGRQGRQVRAFTLIELLVVISIISLLATVTLASLNDARASARDAKRVSDLKEVQKALELYYNDSNGGNGSYPSTGGSSCDDDDSDGDSNFQEALQVLVDEELIPSIPNDPTNTSPYCYHYEIDEPSTGTFCEIQDPAYRLYFTSEGTQFNMNYYISALFTPNTYCLLPAS